MFLHWSFDFDFFEVIFLSQSINLGNVFVAEKIFAQNQEQPTGMNMIGDDNVLSVLALYLGFYIRRFLHIYIFSRINQW